MKITEIEVRGCTLGTREGKPLKLRGSETQLSFVVVTIHTDEGVSGSSLGFGGKNADVAAKIVASAARELLIGKDPLARLGHWRDYRLQDRWWNLFPIWTYGPIDVALWDIAGKVAQLPVYELLGWCRESVPTYASSMVHDSVDDYVAEALAVKARGLRAYKVHAAGHVEEDLIVYSAVREAVGDQFTLMCDPVAAYSFDDALRVGREIQTLGYSWFEEPIFDSNATGLKKLSDALDIPVIATEVLTGSPEVIADYLSRGVVDAVRGDVSWKGGITGLLQIATVAESFGAQCEVHTAIYHPLEIANLHALCAIPNSKYFEVLWPLEDYAFGMLGSLDIDESGVARPPRSPGLGIELDWDLIDNTTVAKP